MFAQRIHTVSALGASTGTIVGIAEGGDCKMIVVDADNADLMHFYIRDGFTPTGMDGELSL